MSADELASQRKYSRVAPSKKNYIILNNEVALIEQTPKSMKPPVITANPVSNNEGATIKKSETTMKDFLARNTPDFPLRSGKFAQPLVPLKDKLWVTDQAYAKLEQRTIDICIPHHGLIGTRTTVTDCQRNCILLTIAEERKSLIIVRNEKGKEICSLQSTRPNVDIRRFISSSHSKKYSNTTKNIYSDRKRKKLLLTIDKSMTSAETYLVSGRNCENNLPFNITIVSSLDQKSARAYLGWKKGALIACFEMNMQSSKGIANIISNVTAGLDLAIATTICFTLERELFHLTVGDIPNLDYHLLSMKTLHLNLTASKLQLQTKNFVDVIVRIPSSDSIHGVVECLETGEKLLRISATKKEEITLYSLEGLAICNLRIRVDATEYGAVFEGDKSDTKLFSVINCAPIFSTKLLITGKNLGDKSKYTICVKGLWISKGFILLTLGDKFGPIVASVQLPPFNYLTREDKEFTLSISMGVDLSIVTMIVIALNQFNATTF